jgi:hypothetical protein
MLSSCFEKSCWRSDDCAATYYMSNTPESKSPEMELDLDLHFLPAWAQKAPDTNRFAKYQGNESVSEGRGDRRPRRGGPREGGGRPFGDRPPRRDGGPGGGGGGRPQGGGFGQRGGDRRGGPRFGGGDRRPMERREPEQPLPQLNINFFPEEKGVESLAKQIRLTGRAYPLFDIAHLVLKKPDRYHVQFNTIIKDEKPVEPLFLCGIDETLWLSEQEALDYVLEKYFSTFYQTERIATDPPKGTYTFVAQCGMSGTILGPPNYHDYQNKLRKLHSEKFSRMPFEAFKARIKIVREEAVVKKWLEDQSWKNEYVCLNVPEPLRLLSREDVDKHFREVHMPEVIKSVPSYTLNGPVATNLPCRQLQNLVRRCWEEQRRFPLRLVTSLSQQFAKHGLQFFKVDKTVTHVAVARPHFLDLENTSVSETVKKIFAFIESHPKCSRRKLIEALLPEAAAALAAASKDPEKLNETAPPSPEMAALVSDLHWLIHQGHVIEFANGTMETAKKPAPKPQRPEKKKEETPVDEASLAAEAKAAATEEAAATAAPEASAVPASEAPASETTPEASSASPEPAPAASPAEPAQESTPSQA